MIIPLLIHHLTTQSAHATKRSLNPVIGKHYRFMCRTRAMKYENNKWRGEWYPGKVEFIFNSETAGDMKVSYADFAPEETKANGFQVREDGALDSDGKASMIIMEWVGPNYGFIPFGRHELLKAPTWNAMVSYSGWDGLGEVTNVGEVPFKYSIVSTSSNTSTITMKRDQPIRLKGKMYLQSARVTYIVDNPTGLPLKITGKETQPGYKLEYRALRSDSITLPTPRKLNQGP